MGFPENVLTSGEKVELKMHPHWRDIAGPIVIALILIAGASYIAWLTPDDTKGNWIQWIVVAVAVLLAIPLAIIPVLRWFTTHYVVTSHRVLVRKGILTKSGKDITLSKITDVSFTRTLLDRMVGSGTLDIETAGDSPDEIFKSVPHSDRVQQLLNHLIDQDANRRAQRIVNRAGFETEQEAADRMHEEEQRMHEEEERLASARSTEAGNETGTEPRTEAAPKPTTEP